MKVFNSIQITALLAAGPVLIPLLNGATFTGAQAIFYLSVIVYIILFVWTVIAHAEFMK